MILFKRNIKELKCLFLKTLKTYVKSTKHLSTNLVTIGRSSFHVFCILTLKNSPRREKLFIPDYKLYIEKTEQKNKHNRMLKSKLLRIVLNY